MSGTVPEGGPLGGVINGLAVVRRYGAVEHEVRAIRTSVALSDLSYVAVARVTGDAAYDVLEAVCPAELYLRDGQLLHTLFLRDDGTVLSDVYVGNDDGAYLVLAEGVSASELERYLAERLPPGSDAAVENLSATHTVLAINGPFAWELLAAVEGPEVIGFPYLSFYRPDADRVYFRAGKTGEFGYYLLVPRDRASALAQTIAEAGTAFDLAFAGTDALAHCALENWFFDVRVPGYSALTPLELQLQWRLGPRKTFAGSEVLHARAAKGIAQRITGFESDALLVPGDEIFLEDTRIGSVVDAARSITVGTFIGVALLDRPYAHSGIDRFRARRDGAIIALRTVSPPFVNNLSLFVNPQRHAYVDRGEVKFPGPARPGAR